MADKRGRRNQSWKKRWFWLKDGCLHYSKTKNGKDLGVIRLENATHIKADSNARPKKKNVFEIPTPDRTYFLCADTQEDRDEWISLCQAAKKAEVEKYNPSSRGGGGGSGKGGKAAASSSREAEEEEPQRVGVEDFDLLTVIGKGSFGKVLQVRKRDTGQIYAMKVLNKATILERGEMEHTKSEKSILQKLQSPFLVCLHFTFQTSDKLYFIMDYVNGGELFFHLQKERKFDAERVRFYCAEIVLGLAYLHSKGILYRDLKLSSFVPENVLLTGDGHICMTDFGISKEGLSAADDRTATFCGTPEYLAPEVLEGNGYGKAVDWWSFGTLMFEMLTGLPPFYSQDVQVMYQKIMTAKLVIPETISSDAASLLRGLLERDQGKRLQDPEVIKAHPYFKSVDWKAMARKEVRPPFVPNQTGSLESTECIDPEFTGQEVKLTYQDTSHITTADQDNFSGFTFQQENEYM